MGCTEETHVDNVLPLCNWFRHVGAKFEEREVHVSVWPVCMDNHHHSLCACSDVFLRFKHF